MPVRPASSARGGYGPSRRPALVFRLRLTVLRWILALVDKVMLGLHGAFTMRVSNNDVIFAFNTERSAAPKPSCANAPRPPYAAAPPPRRGRPAPRPSRAAALPTRRGHPCRRTADAAAPRPSHAEAIPRRRRAEAIRAAAPPPPPRRGRPTPRPSRAAAPPTRRGHPAPPCRRRAEAIRAAAPPTPPRRGHPAPSRRRRAEAIRAAAPPPPPRRGHPAPSRRRRAETIRAAAPPTPPRRGRPTPRPSRADAQRPPCAHAPPTPRRRADAIPRRHTNDVGPDDEQYWQVGTLASPRRYDPRRVPAHPHDRLGATHREVTALHPPRRRRIRILCNQRRCASCNGGVANDATQRQLVCSACTAQGTDVTIVLDNKLAAVGPNGVPFTSADDGFSN